MSVFLTTWGCASELLEMLKLKTATRVKFIIFVGAKTQSQKLFTFLTIWRCAGDFFNVLLKFKMTVTDQFHNLLWTQKLY